MKTTLLRVCWTAGFSLAMLGLDVPIANAKVTSVKVDYSAPFGTYGGRTYLYKEVTVEGTVDRAAPKPQGHYSVGMILVYPQSNGNGVGLVDFVNTIFFYRYPAICPRKNPFCNPDMDGNFRRRLETMAIRFAPLTFEDYMWQNGYTYASIGWDKTVTDFFGATIPDGRHNRLAFGTIEDPHDSLQILADAAMFLRDPSTYQGSDGPTKVDKVISYGYSQTACVQQTFMAKGANVQNGTNAYDAFMLGNIGLVCWEFDSVNSMASAAAGNKWMRYGDLTACTGLPKAANAKTMIVASETELELFYAALSRGDGMDPNYVQYELAGVSHLPPPTIDTSVWGATSPDPADARPFYRGALKNLTDWIQSGTKPPPGIPIQGTENLMTMPPSWMGMVDADMNVLGGTRLPHMPSMGTDGQPAGAPTGTYSGIDPAGIMPLNIWWLLAGKYTRFSDAELMKRYPTPDVYQGLIKKAADKLLADKYILQADHDAYVANAQAPMLPDVTKLMPANTTPVSTTSAGCSIANERARRDALAPWAILLGFAGWMIRRERKRS